jgi:hypothetical protein
MEINLTLVSTKRTIIISLIWIIVIQFLFFNSLTSWDLKLYFSFIILGLGAILLYYLLKFFARFKITVEINKNFIRLGDQKAVYWDSIRSYEYSNTGLLAGLIFRTDNETVKIIGLTRGPEGKKFDLIKEHVFKILEERELSTIYPRILPYDFHSTKGGKIGGYITISICAGAAIFILYLMISNHKITSKGVLGLIAIIFSIILLLIKLSNSRKQNN